MITIDRFGNTTSASIPSALDVAVTEGRLKEGDLVVLCSFGAGFTWGAMLLRWTAREYARSLWFIVVRTVPLMFRPDIGE